MKRLLFALGLAVIAAAAQAQTADERFPKPSTENPSWVAALRGWLASKSAATTDTTTATRSAVEPKRVAEPKRAAEPRHTAETHHHYRERAHSEHRYRVLEVAAPKPATVAPAAPPTRAITAEPVMTTASVTTASAAPIAPPRENLTMPRPVATITVIAPAPGAARQRHGRHDCTSGERVITAFYWEGKYTASGARFDPDGMTAAHRSFPFGTKILVINPRNGRSVTVTINDRGPFVKGVTLDLSRGAAKAIGLQGNAAVCMAKL